MRGVPLLVSFALVLACANATVPAPPSPPAAAPTPTPPLSPVEDLPRPQVHLLPGIHIARWWTVVEDLETLESLSLEGDLPTFVREIDFSRERLALAELVLTSGSIRIDLREVRQDDEAYRVRYRIHTPRIGTTDMKTTVLYAVVPRDGRAVAFLEEDEANGAGKRVDVPAGVVDRATFRRLPPLMLGSAEEYAPIARAVELSNRRSSALPRLRDPDESTPPPPAPRFDFERVRVAAFTLGPRRGERTVRVSVAGVGDTWHLRVEHAAYAEDWFDEPATLVLVELPRDRRRVVAEGLGAEAPPD